jgi:hypothetical protein
MAGELAMRSQRKRMSHSPERFSNPTKPRKQRIQRPTQYRNVAIEELFNALQNMDIRGTVAVSSVDHVILTDRPKNPSLLNIRTSHHRHQ